MTKRKKIIVGVLSFWPLIYFVVFFIGITTLVLTSSGEPTYIDPGSTAAFAVFGGLGLLFVLHMLSMILIITMMVVLCKHVYKNPGLSQDAKLPWYVALVFVNMLAFPLYWYYHIWNNH